MRLHTPDPLMRAGWEVEYNEMEYITGCRHAIGLAFQRPAAPTKHTESFTQISVIITGKNLLISYYIQMCLLAQSYYLKSVYDVMLNYTALLLCFQDACCGKKLFALCMFVSSYDSYTT